MHVSLHEFRKEQYMIRKDNISIGQTVYMIEYWTNNIVRGTVNELLSGCASIKRECFVDNQSSHTRDFSHELDDFS